MSERYTIGSYALVIIVLFIAFNYVVSLTAFYFGLLNNMVANVEAISNGDYGKLGTFIGFLLQLFTWWVYIFSNDMQLAVLIGLALLYEAVESEWF